MNLDDLSYIDHKITGKAHGEKKYYQQYLIPSYYLEIHFRWAEKEELHTLHRTLIETLGHLLTWHHHSHKSKASRIKEREKAFAFFPNYLTNPKGATGWNLLTNVAGTGKVGKPKEFGGVGDASVEYFVNRNCFRPELQGAQIAQYKKNLVHFNTDMLHSGVIISSIRVSFPVDFFESPIDLLEYSMNLNLIESGHFFSATGGYKINYYEGYSNKEAEKRLLRILNKYPGFEYDAPYRAAILGRFLNKEKTDILPIVKRLNWLSFVSGEGVKIAGGMQKLTREIEKGGISKVHPLKQGGCIQVSPVPALAEGDEGFEQYYTVARVLEPLLFKPHIRDSQPFRKEGKDIFRNWFFKYHQG